VWSVVLTVNSQNKSIKSHTKPIKCKYFCHFICFVCDFIDFVCEFTVKTTEHTVLPAMKAVILKKNRFCWHVSTKYFQLQVSTDITERTFSFVFISCMYFSCLIGIFDGLRGTYERIFMI
jgi:hypothetical protein